MSCVFGGGSPTPWMTSPFSVQRGLLEQIAAALRLFERVAVQLAEILGNVRVLRLAKLASELYQGPVPMRSRALTAGWPGRACVLR